MQVQFELKEQYTEAWMFLMIIGAGFKYCRDEQWVELDPTDDPEEDADTMARLKEIQQTKSLNELVR